MNTHADVPIRDAATVVLLRDGADGLETFLLQRNGETAFGPGFYVFPGGAVDEADADLEGYCDGLDDAEASRCVGVTRGGLALWVAAVRECFEECGLLLATDQSGRDLAASRDLAADRAALNAGSLAFGSFCRQAGLRLSLDRLLYYNHWTTPAGPPRRFSTRFFACAAPQGQDIAIHDGAETVASGWETPHSALAAFKAGDYPMMPPTVAQLRFLANYRSREAALAALASGTVPPDHRKRDALCRGESV